MEIELTKEETENLILATLDYLQQSSNCPENGVSIKNLARNTNIELDEIKKYIQELRLKKVVSWRFDQARNGEYYIYPTEPTIENFDKLNALTIRETAMLILDKSYDIYRRAGYDSMFQFDSAMVGSIAGINNTSKIRSAIEMLDSKGLINNPAIMTDNIIYFISAKGIDMIENGPEKHKTDSTTIINNGGNIAINSNNVRQSIKNNELSEYFTTLEMLIKENLNESEKSNALNDLETVKELSKADQPKKHLIQHILNNLDKIPILVETIKKIKECFFS